MDAGNERVESSGDDIIYRYSNYMGAAEDFVDFLTQLYYYKQTVARYIYEALIKLYRR